MEQIYNLIEIHTEKKTPCKKVIAEDGFEYYISLEKVKGGTFESLPLEKNTIRGKCRVDAFIYETKTNKVYPTDFENGYVVLDKHFLVIASNNPNIEFCKIMTEVEYLQSQYTEKKQSVISSVNLIAEGLKTGILIGVSRGFNTHAEKYPYSVEDMINFHKWAFQQIKWNPSDATTEELLTIWKSQQPKILYYAKQ